MTAPGKPMREVREIIVHHSLTPDLPDPLSAGAIRRYHVNRNKWDDVGYHAIVERARGEVEVLFGRPMDRTGAHCRGHNDASLGVCFVGDFDHEEPDDELLEVAAQRFFVPMMAMHGLGLDQIRGDRDHHPTKTCPGEMFDLERLRQIVGRTMATRISWAG